MPETIFVTGATGKVGSRVVKQLLQRAGDDVRVVAGVRSASKAEALQAAGAHIAEIDLNAPGTLDQAFGSVNQLFLVTPGSMNMVQEATNAVAAAEAAGVKRIVRLSVMNAEAEPGITLTRLHRSAELMIMGSGLDWTFLRPSGFMQNFEAFAGSIKSQGAFYQPLENAKVSYIDVDDIANVAATILLRNSQEDSGRAYDLTGPEALTSQQVAETFSRVLGKPVAFQAISDDAAAEAMAKMGMPQPVVEMMLELYQDLRRGEGATVSNAVGSITGRAAKSFQQYVADNRAAYS